MTIEGIQPIISSNQKSQIAKASVPINPVNFQNMLSEIIQKPNSIPELSQQASSQILSAASVRSPQEASKMGAQLFEEFVNSSKRKKNIAQENIDRISKNTYAQLAPEEAFSGEGEPLSVRPRYQQTPYDRAPDQNVGTGHGYPLTPFQFFIDKSLEFFGKLSELERVTDQLMVDYVQDEISLEELTIAKAKVGVGLSFATTILQQVQTAFNQIAQMNV